MWDILNLSTTYRLYQLTKTSASILPMVRTNPFYFAVLKNCFGGWGVDFD